MDSSADRIVPLDQLDDFKVAEGDPDVRGWDVLTADGLKFGEVDNLLVDTAALKVRYLDVDIDDDLIETDVDRHILIPIGYARLDEDDDRIFVDSLNSTTLNQIPDYRLGSLTRDYETKLHGFFDIDNEFAGSESDRDFYAHRSYSDNDFYGTRRSGEEQRVTRSEEDLAVENETVEADLRRERGDVRREGDAEVRDQR
ncbi:MAG TPA: PRC-barrel domain-containing protein [Longimicrobiaceae bacterium]|nr:PRC-barrel domain-containing protein [Longimicrobiaceae bacterium]